MEANKPVVNIIVWSDNNSGAEIAKLVSGTTEGSDLFIGEKDDYTVKVFLRGTNVVYSAHPASGIADALIVSFVGQNEEAVKYLEQRKGIPTKLVISETDLNEFAKERGATYYSTFDGVVAEGVVKTAIAADQVLRKSFAVIDKDSNGFITKDELVTVSKELSHDISPTDAEEISKAISKDGKIPFADFKKWWFTGKADFPKFKKIVELEIKLNKFVKKGTGIIGDYIDKLNKNVNDQTNSELKSNFTLKPINDFENGINIGFSSHLGKSTADSLQDLPAYYATNPITVALEIGIDNPESGSAVVEQLDQLKQMIFAMIPEIEEKLSLGVDIKFRHVGNSVFIEGTLGGFMGDMVYSQIASLGLDFNLFNYAGSFQFISGLKLNNPFEITIDEIISRVSQIKILGNGEAFNVKAVINIASQILSKAPALPEVAKKFVPQLLKLFSIFKLFSLNSEYDSDEFAKIIKEIVVENAAGEEALANVDEVISQMLGVMISNLQEGGKAQVEAAKAMLGMFLGPFLGSLSAINFDKISLNATVAPVNLQIKYTLGLVGITEFLRNNLFN